MTSESSCDISYPSTSSGSNVHPPRRASKSNVISDFDTIEVKPDVSQVNLHQEDCYDHISPDIMYSAVNIPGPGANLDDINSQLAMGCHCTDGQCNSIFDCQCISRYGINYSEGLLNRENVKGSIIECNSECLCNHQNKCCQNRLVQIGPLVDLEVFLTDIKGYGLKCRNKILNRSFICEYAGEVISLAEGKRRVTSSNAGMNYVFVLNEHTGDKVLQTCIDPKSIGNIGRYVNHSCQPNAAIFPVRVDSPVPSLAIFAIQDIEAGEEITMDYGGDGGKRPDGADLKLCHCGASNCRTYLPFDADLL